MASHFSHAKGEPPLFGGDATVKRASNQPDGKDNSVSPAFHPSGWQSTPRPREHFWDVENMAKSDEQPASDAHFREIAEKIRKLARQTHIAEAKAELLALADRLDRAPGLAGGPKVD